MANTCERNRSIETPHRWVHAGAAGVITEDLILAQPTDVAFRRIWVGHVAGPVILFDIFGAEHTFDLETLQGYPIIDGQWSGIKASGTTSYKFHCGQ